MNGKLLQRDIDMKIKNVQFYVFPGTTLTVCCLTLKNGYTVTGESACLDWRDFNAETGKDLSYKQAKEKVWVLEGYLAKEKSVDAVEGVGISIQGNVARGIMNQNQADRGGINQLVGEPR